MKIVKLIGGIIAAIVGIITIISGILTLIKTCEPPPPPELIYQGSVQDKVTRKYIAEAEITFIGLTNKIKPCQTDSKGCFSISLSDEYPNVKIMITHKDYETQEFYRQLIKKDMKEPDIFYLTPCSKEKSNGISPPSIIKTITKPGTNNPIGSTQKKIEAIGESGYKLNERWAREEAVKNAKNELMQKLNKSDISYEIDEKRSTVDLVDGEGYKAKIVIFTYK